VEQSLGGTQSSEPAAADEMLDVPEETDGRSGRVDASVLTSARSQLKTTGLAQRSHTGTWTVAKKGASPRWCHAAAQAAEQRALEWTISRAPPPQAVDETRTGSLRPTPRVLAARRVSLDGDLHEMEDAAPGNGSRAAASRSPAQDSPSSADADALYVAADAAAGEWRYSPKSRLQIEDMLRDTDDLQKEVQEAIGEGAAGASGSDSTALPHAVMESVHITPPESPEKSTERYGQSAIDWHSCRAGDECLLPTRVGGEVGGGGGRAGERVAGRDLSAGGEQPRHPIAQTTARSPPPPRIPPPQYQPPSETAAPASRGSEVRADAFSAPGRRAPVPKLDLGALSREVCVMMWAWHSRLHALSVCASLALLAFLVSVCCRVVVLFLDALAPTQIVLVLAFLRAPCALSDS